MSQRLKLFSIFFMWFTLSQATSNLYAKCISFYFNLLLLRCLYSVSLTPSFDFLNCWLCFVEIATPLLASNIVQSSALTILTWVRSGCYNEQIIDVKAFANSTLIWQERWLPHFYFSVFLELFCWLVSAPLLLTSNRKMHESY